MDKQTATEIANTALRVSKSLNDLTHMSGHLAADDAMWLRQQVGAMALNANDILRGVARHYPDLDPDRP
jgi:hypothetical protein